jgi:hypothetical protein
MACIVQDLIAKFDHLNAPQPVVYATVYATPATVPVFVSTSGVFHEGAMFLPRVTATDSSGTYSFTLPWPSEQDPAATKWIITLPDNSRWMGTLPEGISGPLSIHDLKQTYGWGLISATSSDYIPVAVQGPSGLLGSFASARRPPASSIQAGAYVWNTDTHIPNFSDGTQWRDAAGNVV